ncbi:ecdysteroid-regulated 16 kDa protein-like [Brevipalpus obovatus]|uniref:ecdysteroid-regulated 16 kDa protein-like n=1 Tax=Brevipalpus obovatus TaxID=246614 RepID=UPI003D9DDA8D
MQSIFYSMLSSHICVLITFLIVYQSYSIDAETFYKDCGSRGGQLNSLMVSGCDMKPAKSRSAVSDRCSFIRGSNVTLFATFTPEVDSANATVKVYGTLVVPIPFYIEPDACKAWGTKCPLAKGIKNTLNITLPIRTEYPSVSVGVKLILNDGNEKPVFCTFFPAVIEEKKAS